mmetsp:Transcript_37616/g.65271  ORF Transcript_37616/g.65271 Transcript_37616/m.65271 type:complete len:632 (-) Transcript_37616:339-2234(-)
MKILSVSVSLLVAFLIPLIAKGDRVRAGYTYPLTIDSDNDDRSQIKPEVALSSSSLGRGGKKWTLHYEEATYVAVHFSTINLRNGEYLHITDANGGQDYIIEHGKTTARQQQSSFWAQHIKGETMIIELVSSHKHRGDSVFEIDEIGLGDANIEDEDVPRRSLRAKPSYKWGDEFHHGGRRLDNCGVNDRKNAVCYKDDYPVHYQTAQAVARLLIQGAWLCTGWLASDSNHLITNQHCIASDSDALNTDYEFDAETPTCEEANGQLKTPGVVFTGGDYIMGDAGKDYAVIQLDGDASESYPHLEFDMDLAIIPTDSSGDAAFRDAVLGTEMYLPQHSAGWDKEFGIESTHAEDQAYGASKCHVLGSYTASCTASSGYYEVGYYCDSLGGSSGSAVISGISHKVIALHHCGCTGCACYNIGVPINEVYADICANEALAADWNCGNTMAPTISKAPTSPPTPSPTLQPTVTKAPTVPVTCEGACGTQDVTGSCWCDSLCVDYGDCCQDACEFCGYGEGCSTNSASCEGACGGQDATGSCWCDSMCADYGDCCEDACEHCGIGEDCSTATAAPSGSCAAEGETCSDHSDCCDGACKWEDKSNKAAGKVCKQGGGGKGKGGKGGKGNGGKGKGSN